MSAELALYAALRPLVADRVYPDVAPSNAALPRIVFQQIGGQSTVYADNVAATQENARMQVVCWATTRLAATALAKQVEDTLLAATTCTATPLGARVSDFEPDTGLYAARQDFSVWATR